MPDPTAEPLPPTVKLWLGMALIVLLSILLLFMLFLMLVRRGPRKVTGVSKPSPTTPDPWTESARRLRTEDLGERGFDGKEPTPPTPEG